MKVQRSFAALIGDPLELSDKELALFETGMVLAIRMDSAGTETKDLPRLTVEYVRILDRLAPDSSVPDVVSDLGQAE